MLRGIGSLYSLGLPTVLISQWRKQKNSTWKLLRWFWQSKSYTERAELAAGDKLLSLVLSLGMVAQIAVGVALLVDWARFGTTGAWAFGTALIISYPLVWAHAFALGASIPRLVYFVFSPKKAGRAVVCSMLESQVKSLRKRHTFTVVAVAGSVGKTSTKLAIADLLGQTLRVRHQTGNYNERVTVPLVFFGVDEPSLFDVFAWLKIFRSNDRQITGQYPYDVIVVELGTDKPGDLAEFAYMHPDISVVTAVSPEHMEFFGTLDAVAAEELTVFDYSKQVLVNGDDIAGEYLAGRKFAEYSTASKQAGYYGGPKSQGLKGQDLTVTLPKGKLQGSIQYAGLQGAKVALAAVAVADMAGVPQADIAKGLSKLQPFAGRMQILEGRDDTTIIDDTYNASPLAVKAALDVLYAAKTKQRIAILGGMNELGDYSRKAHEEIGAYCDPGKLEMVVTIGTDAKQWLAPAATKAGCNVESFDSPYHAGQYVRDHLQKGAVILAKGSQNGVFAEEALKYLVDSKEWKKLVRQTEVWMTKKQQQFGKPLGLLPGS